MKSKSIVDKIPQSFKAPDKAKALNFDFGFWDEALLLDTDPPTDPKPTEPTPETKPEAPKEPVETSTSSTPEDVKTTVQTALKEFFEALKPADPKPTEPTPDPKPEEPKEPTQDPQMDMFKTMMRDLLIESKGVPDYLAPLVPQDPIKAKEFLSSEAYTKLKTQLNLVSKPLNETPETKPTEPTPDPKPDPSRTTPESKMPKTFGEVTNEMLADMMKGL